MNPLEVYLICKCYHQDMPWCSACAEQVSELESLFVLLKGDVEALFMQASFVCGCVCGGGQVGEVDVFETLSWGS